MEMTPEMEGVFGEEDADASSAADSEALPTRTKPTPSKPFVEEL